MISAPLVRYVLQAASRDRLIISFIGLTLLGVSLAMFIGGAAIVEQQQFITVFAAGGLRLLSVIAACLFIAFYIQRSFAQRDVEFLLTRPLDRSAFIVSHAVAFVIVSLVLAVLSTAAVIGISFTLVTPSYLLWGASLFAEITIMSLVTLFLAMVLPSATVTALIAIAFYILARIIGQLMGIVDTNSALWGNESLGIITKGISVFIPRFDLMTQTSWLVYGPHGHEGFLFITAQTLAFSFLVLIAAIIDLKRRQF